MSRRIQHHNIRKALAAFIASGGFKPGEELPSYAELAERFGGSPKSVMPAVLALEKEGILLRKSPRKILVADHSEEWTSAPVGLINFGGHVFEDMGHQIVRRLYDRKIPTSMLVPFGNSDIEITRWFKRFFSTDYRALIVHDNIQIPVRHIEDHVSQIGRLIVVETPFNVWKTPHYGVYVDRSFCCLDALERMRDAGCRRLHVLISSKPPGASNPRDSYMAGYEKFMEADRGRCECMLEDPFRIALDMKLARRWASALKEGDGIFAHSDYHVVAAMEQIERFSSIDFREFLYVGVGDTPWSQIGVRPFPSYDLRSDDIVEMILQIIDAKNSEPCDRRIKPMFVREELLERQGRK